MNELHQCGLCNELKNKTNVIKEYEYCFIMFNRDPYLPGHIMVVCKRPVVSLADCTKEEKMQIIEVVSSSQQLIMKGLKIKSTNIGINTGPDSGGSILDHLHIHIVPRNKADMNFMHTIAGSTNKYPGHVKDARKKIIEIFNV